MSRHFGMTAEFWLNLQAGYEKEAAPNGMTTATLAEIVPMSKSKAHRMRTA